MDAGFGKGRVRAKPRLDNTQIQVVAALREAGAAVTSLASAGAGIPDLLVSYRGQWFLIECKSPGGRLTEKQRRWHGSQQAPIYVCQNGYDALEAIHAAPITWREAMGDS